ncbi:MAG: DUF6178 family protein [Vicinamibacterales bacterium]
MSKRRAISPAFPTRPSLRTLIDSSNLSAVVPRLTAPTLHRLVRTLGLEDAGDILVHASPRQLAEVFDADLWKGAGAAASEQFDPARFGLWLRVLVEADVDVAARQLQALGLEFVSTALGQHIAVCSRATAELRGLLDGEAATWECGGVVLVSRRTDAWDAITELATHLHAEYEEYFDGLMAACRNLSYEYLEEESGFDVLRGRREQALDDLAFEREERLEAHGYVTRPHAKAFLDAARLLSLDGLMPAPDATFLSYRRDVDANSLSTRDDEPIGQDNTSSDMWSDTREQEEHELAALVAAIDEASDTTTHVRGFLTSGPDERPTSLVAAQLRQVADVDAHAYARNLGELAFLSNVILESGLLLTRKVAESDAVDAVVATCDLGLACWPSHWTRTVATLSLVDAFRVGWAVLYRNVSLHSAQALLDTLSRIPTEDTPMHDDARALRQALTRAIQRERPWEAKAMLEVLAIMDLPTWATLQFLLDEFPAVPKGCLKRDGTPGRLLRVGTEFEYVQSHGHLDWVRQFTARLLTSLSS